MVPPILPTERPRIIVNAASARTADATPPQLWAGPAQRREKHGLLYTEFKLVPFHHCYGHWTLPGVGGDLSRLSGTGVGRT